MLIRFEIKSQQIICYLLRFVSQDEEQTFHISFYQKGTSHPLSLIDNGLRLYLNAGYAGREDMVKS